MSLLTIAEAVAKNVGIEIPTVVKAATTRNEISIVQFTQEAADELVRRVEWSALRSTTVITGTGTNDNFALPASFSHLTEGMAVKTGSAAVRGGLSPDEWFSLTATVGTPRYFRLLGSTISFYPYPALSATVSVSYQSKFWCSNGTNLWSADANTALVPEDLIVKGAVWRWKRHIGTDYADYLAEFEAALADRAAFDDGDRTP